MSSFLYLPNQAFPLSNINQHLANSLNQHNPSQFGSNETNLQWGLPAARNNIDAANSFIPKTGGSNKKKTIKKKIKNIVNKYKMKNNKKTIRTLLQKLKQVKKSVKSKSRFSRKTSFRRKSRGTRKIRGGYYKQFMSNEPYTPSYSTAGPLNPSLSALANPVPYQPINNCQDNYNHFNNSSFII